MSKKQTAQKKLIGELKKQLLVQAERLGIKDQYTALYMEELKLDAAAKILTEFYMERSNLEYELHLLGSQKKEILIKLERLNAYINKTANLHGKHLDKFEKLIAKGLGDRQKTQKALTKLKPAMVSVAA